jgi:hypothetical protein
VAWREDSADSYFDVTQLEDGRVVAGFMHSGYDACGPYESPCARTGYRYIDTEPTPTATDGHSFPVRTQKNSEVHDVELLASGGALLSDMDRERIVIVRNGSVVWQWNASTFYDAPPDVTRRDWLHVNDVDVIEPDRYLVSVRNANQLLVVDRQEGVVEVINEDTDASDDGACQHRGQLKDFDGDGDIRCGDPTVLNHQHNPQWLGDGAVLVADSDNDRVVELHRQPNGSWVPAWTATSADGVTLQWPRDADRLENGHTLITDTLNRRIVEINETGHVFWSYETQRIPYEADRLPEGEPPSGQRYGNATGDGTPGQTTPDSGTATDVPLLSTLLIGVRAVIPSLPFWFREPHLLASIVSLLMVLTGASLIVRD